MDEIKGICELSNAQVDSSILTTVVLMTKTVVVLDGTSEPGIAHSFALSSEETTLAQLQKATPYHRGNRESCTTGDCPAGVITWFHAIAYCE